MRVMVRQRLGIGVPDGSADSDTFSVGQILSDAPYFSRRIAEEVARSRRSGVEFSIVVFTIKSDADELPAMACVQSMPRILEAVRETDIVCRIADDSIAVLLIDSGGEGSRAAALRLLTELGEDSTSNWRVNVLEYPERESVLLDLGIVA